MGKISKGDIGCCLVIILMSAAFFVFIYLTKDANKEYLVEYTGYIHSTDDPDKCKFIAIAKDRNYTISRIEKKDAISQGKKICKLCYSLEEQVAYNKDVSDRKEKDLYWSDRSNWSVISLKYDSTDYSKLVVYMERNGVLHIDGDCGWLYGKKKKLERVPFVSITSFKSTCKDCVDGGLCEFIYQAVYNGVYNKDLIRDDDEDNETYYEPAEPEDIDGVYSSRQHP